MLSLESDAQRTSLPQLLLKNNINTICGGGGGIPVAILPGSHIREGVEVQLTAASLSVEIAHNNTN